MLHLHFTALAVEAELSRCTRPGRGLVSIMQGSIRPWCSINSLADSVRVDRHWTEWSHKHSDNGEFKLVNGWVSALMHVLVLSITQVYQPISIIWAKKNIDPRSVEVNVSVPCFKIKSKWCSQHSDNTENVMHIATIIFINDSYVYDILQCAEEIIKASWKNHHLD